MENLTGQNPQGIIEIAQKIEEEAGKLANAAVSNNEILFLKEAAGFFFIISSCSRQKEKRWRM